MVLEYVFWICTHIILCWFYRKCLIIQVGLQIWNIEYWFTFQVNLCSHYLATSRRMVLYPNEPYIHTFQTILRNVCLCSASVVYSILCRGLKYSSKVRYIIVVDPNITGFLISETDRQHCPMSEKYITKMNVIYVW